MYVQARRGFVPEPSLESYPEGIVIPVDKPYRWTSADVIRVVKCLAYKYFHNKKIKVGHAGTLDPLATGVLLVCIGKATRLADEFQRHPKSYDATLWLGATTPSYDREKEVDRICSAEGVDEAGIRSVLETFLGEQEQVAPLFSAKSADGVRAYEIARRCLKESQRNRTAFDHTQQSLLQRNRVNITRLELKAYSAPRSGRGTDADLSDTRSRIIVADVSSVPLAEACISVDCSKGTYIRALARDIGEALGCGAFLGDLRRTASGDFRIGDCLSMDEVRSMLNAARIQ